MWRSNWLAAWLWRAIARYGCGSSAANQPEGQNAAAIVEVLPEKPRERELVRVMLEGKNQDEIRTWAQEIVDVVKRHLG